MSSLQTRQSQRLSNEISKVLGDIDYRLAETDQDREAIFRLRYDAYRKNGSIDQNAERSFADDYDLSPNCWIYGIYLDGDLASSIRIHVANDPQDACPSFGAFPDILGPALENRLTVVDSTRFVVDRDAARRAHGLHMVTLRLCWMAVEFFRAEHFLAAVRSEHQAFYKRTFRHDVICEPRAYALLKKPISLMSVSYDNAVDWVYARYPFFRSNLFERRMLFGAPPNLMHDGDIHFPPASSRTANAQNGPVIQ